MDMELCVYGIQILLCLYLCIVNIVFKHMNANAMNRDVRENVAVPG